MYGIIYPKFSRQWFIPNKLAYNLYHINLKLIVIIMLYYNLYSSEHLPLSPRLLKYNSQTLKNVISLGP